MKAFTLPSLSGRIALVTGASTGIGRVTARELARAGARVFVACRSQRSAAGVLADIAAIPGAQADCLELDLGDFASVRACAEAFLARNLPLHLLINNAGLAGARGLTPSGFELAFGVNHMGHFLLTRCLLDRLKESAPARVVSVASRAHVRAGGLDWDALRRPTRSLTGWPEYANSKLANVLFSAELGKLLAGSGVTTYALHPGVIASDIWRRVPWPLRRLMTLGMIDVEEGARTTLHCATAPEVAGESGLYYSESRAIAPSAMGSDAGLAAELWKRSEAWLARDL